MYRFGSGHVFKYVSLHILISPSPHIFGFPFQPYSKLLVGQSRHQSHHGTPQKEKDRTDPSVTPKSSYFSNEGDTVINTRDSAQMLIESSVWESCPKKGIFSNDSGAGPGYAVVRDLDLGGSQNLVAAGTLTSVPYTYTLLGSANTKAAVMAKAGQKLSF
jgi:hypothetical protein